MSAVHFDQGGRARCGNHRATRLGDAPEVDCLMCLNIMNGTHAHGNRQTDAPHGTEARYRWHLRHEGAPVRCESCLAALRRRNQDRPGRAEGNARRRERYAAARAAGATSRQASRRKDLGRAS